MIGAEFMEGNIPSFRDDLGGNDSAADAAGRLSHTQSFHQRLFTET
jgi:hypothetical protein